MNLKPLMDLFESHHKIATMTTQNTPIQKTELAFMMLQVKQNEMIIEELRKLNGEVIK
jgi:hypothetical protein